MQDADRKLRSLPVRSNDQLLEALAGASGNELKGTSEGSPYVTLHLISGRDVFGIVAAYTRDRQGYGSVLLQTGGDRRYDQGSDATYVALAAIEAITVHAAPGWIELLASGALRNIAPAPTRLAARRAIEADRERVRNVGASLAWNVDVDAVADGEPLRLLVAHSSAVVKVLEEVAKDALGKEALAKLQGVTVASSTTTTAGLDGKTLQVATATADTAELRRVIEAAL